MSTRAMTDKRWRLHSITLRHFRGVADERTIPFEGRSGLLFGNNGVGKSTVAQALQWILFGKFPENVLQNTAFDRFLAPAQSEGRRYWGEVVLSRGVERASLVRDAASGRFKLTVGRDSYLDEAEAMRDEILGLDMDTFVRTVALQQSRVRGLLLDKEGGRNEAIDRLLGLDSADHLLDVLEPKDFREAAKAWRDRITAKRQEMATEERVLKEQLTKAEETARVLKFLKKESNEIGLKDRYAELSRDLLALGKRYKIELHPLPSCADSRRVASVSDAFAKGLKAIRLESEPKQRTVPLDTAIASFTWLKDQWNKALTARAEAKQRHDGLAEQHGEREALEKERAEAVDRLSELKQELKAADELRQLLEDAGAWIREQQPEACPVCEERLRDRAGLAARLRTRADQMASAEVVKLQTQRDAVDARLHEITGILEEFENHKKLLADAQEGLDTLRARAGECLGSPGIAENRVQARLTDSLAGLETARKKLQKSLEVMEADLQAIDLQERALREGLLPVVQKRTEILAHEERARKADKLYERDARQAEKMERLANQIEAIRNALHEAKQDLARELLDKARPRAQELYGRMVRQPVFDVLEIQADLGARGVNYRFEVRGSKSGAGRRDARLVLSDGQITATALALFFSLAESSGHALDLLFVDDPTQNLDSTCKEAMAKVVVELAGHRQVIVATQDEEFVDFLNGEGMGQHSVIHHLKGWDGNLNIDTKLPQ